MKQLKVYKASAGSGKTYTIALEYIKELLLNDSRNYHRHILAVTFTNDATGEMKNRILAELFGLAFETNDSAGFRDSLQEILRKTGKPMDASQIREKAYIALNNILHDYSRLSITTIDSFFQKILRNLARELGKGSKFNIEMNTAKIRSEAIVSMIEKAHLDKKLIGWLTTYVKTKLENGGNWRIKNEIIKFSACIFDEFFQEHEFRLRKQLDEQPDIFTTLNKEQYKQLKAYKTFFQNTYRQVSDILDKNNLQADDFIRGSIIKFWQKLSDDPQANVTIKIENYLNSAENWVTKSHKRRTEIIALVNDQLIGILADTVDKLSRYHTTRLISGNIHQLGLIWYIVNEIDAINRENNRFMLSDTASLLHKMIDDSDTPFIYEKIGAEIQHVMIDEFQDTSRLQWKNFHTLLSEILDNNNFSMIVGDEKQAIYRWRNGDWRILNTIDRLLNDKAEVKALKFNYRSEKKVIEFNNQLFSEAGSILQTKFKEELTELSDSPFECIYTSKQVSQETKKKNDAGFASVDFIEAPKDTSYKERVFVCLLEKIGELKNVGIAAQDICILTRTNTEIKGIADFLSSKKEDFPELDRENYLRIISNEAFELQSSLAVKIIMEALKVVSDPENSVFKARLDYYLYQAGTRFSGEMDLQNRQLTSMPLFELITYFYNVFNLKELDGQSAYLFFFYDAIYQFMDNHSPDVLSFIAYWEEDLKMKTIPGGEGMAGIRAMTIHKSKGLQFHTVLIPYCTWELNPKFNPVVWCERKSGIYDLELLPVNYTSSMGETVFSKEYQYETSLSWLDNLNLLYVAFTRAEQNLIIFGKNKQNLKNIADVKTVSDLLQWSIVGLSGKWDPETLHFENGTLTAKKKTETQPNDNLLKQLPQNCDIVFRAEEFAKDKSIFKQSNKSREFIKGETSSGKEKYVAYGSVMHELFSRIQSFEDIESAVHDMICEGLILPEKENQFVEKTKNSIREAEVEHWFDGSCRSYSEQSIIVRKGNDITTRRPDRILFSDDSTLVIDYKFGKPHSSHQKQMKEYLELLKEMGYSNLKAYLWYVEKGEILNVAQDAI